MSADLKRVKRCIALANMAEIDPAAIGAWSSGERIIVALLHNRMDWLPSHVAHPLDALEALGEQWQMAVLQAHRFGWSSEAATLESATTPVDAAIKSTQEEP